MPKGYVDVEDQQEFSDADFRVVDNADQSKKAKVDLSGSATNTAAKFVLEGQQITTVASSGTTNIGAANTTEVSISGTTTITAFDTVQAGIKRSGVFQGALTLTHNGTSLILPGAANITTAAGDTFEALSLGSGNWRVLWYTKASGASVVAGGLTLGTDTATTSGTTVTLTGMPSTTKQITLNWRDGSVSGNSQPGIKLGTGGAVVSTGYVGNVFFVNATPSVTAAAWSTYANLTGTNLATALVAQMTVTLTLVNAASNIWQISSQFTSSGSAIMAIGTGYIALSGTIDRVQLFVNANAFDAGNVNIAYQ